ncbi:RelA/SpoT family protein [Candidatus Magnetaquicoccus inordinatus]|uniref:RelA/SpoT family protein n=1 Tax=Candidatus Magnetaquicoccus inordinatus TaxID=2496818 RepID=UPI00102B98A4|nr:bifunctional (p)ppGpp synthetase/guanosine-3',5'-bis(diphosphate) 3'-pyrophosphohydrolase [Candidatus Magnetaquicoccus inordinatus]
MDASLRYQIRSIAKTIRHYNKDFNLKKFLSAVRYSMDAHQGQTRKSGEDYIWHPIRVTEILADYEADEKTIIAAMLHDIVEDTPITAEEIQATFGEDIAHIVEGVTKLGRLNFSSAEEAKVENFRKMFLAMAKDIRIIIIKLADRLHNMRTLKYLEEDRRKRIARETLDIYAPLSHRLGMSNIKWELEDLCFRFLYEQDYQKLKQEISAKREEREQYIQNFVSTVTLFLKEESISPRVDGRPKHFWSIYNKMIKQRTSIKNLYDLYAIRIIVGNVKECYAALGTVHTRYKPIPGRFKDYIAMPKQNMYQSIHTVVIGPEGKPVEVQIRTEEMHRISEFGIAAHWRYKEGRVKEEPFEKKMAWLRELVEGHDDVDNKDYYEHLKIDLFTDEIFVFTPKGDVYELPTAATPLDFAYRVHSEIGHRCIGAKVNTQIVNLDIQLTNGDIVEIITSNVACPRFSWLSIVKTSSARNKIKQWLKKNTTIYAEEKTKEEDDRIEAPREEDRLVKTIEAIQEGKTEKLKRKNAGIIVQDGDDVLTYLSRCCNPVPGDDIMGYITKGRGIAVHRMDCHNLKHVDRARLIRVQWDKGHKGHFELALEVLGYDRVGLLNDIVARIAEMRINILNGQIRTTASGKAVVNLILNILDVSMLEGVIAKLKMIKDVIEVRRVTNG